MYVVRTLYSTLCMTYTVPTCVCHTHRYVPYTVSHANEYGHTPTPYRCTPMYGDTPTMYR